MATPSRTFDKLIKWSDILKGTPSQIEKLQKLQDGNQRGMFFADYDLRNDKGETSVKFLTVKDIKDCFGDLRSLFTVVNFHVEKVDPIKNFILMVMSEKTASVYIEQITWKGEKIGPTALLSL